MQYPSRFLRLFGLAVFLMFTSAMFGQSLATVQGQVTDQSGAAIPGAEITVTNTATGVSFVTRTDSVGNYQMPALRIGNYDVSAKSSGLESAVAKGLVLEVGRTTVQNFQLKIAQANEVITVEGATPVIESATITVGQTIEQKTVQDIPLNGRHFVDLALLTPGTVVPPANGFLTVPLRGQGAFAVVTAGNRETSTNYMINGINMNDMLNGQITFQPTIDTVSEFTINNQTPSAEYGRNSGATVNIATRSGTNQVHGEVYEFIRNNDLDARNFFNPISQPMSPFKRNQFGADVGGPIIHDKTFFFGSYEGLRQRQQLNLSSGVPSDAQRALVTDPNIQKLLALIPHAPGGNATTPAQFFGSGGAPVNIDQGTGDIQHNFSDSDRIHGYYVFQRDERLEPNNSGATVPGGGDARKSHRQLFTLDETHVFDPNLVNDFRLGFNRIRITFTSDSQSAGQDPTQFGINDGLSGPVGIPHFSVAGLGLQFGGEAGFPQGRGDLTAITSDTLSYLHGNHSLKFGGEYRRFIGNTILGDEGTVTYASEAAFLGCNATFTTCGTSQPSTFSVNLGGNHPARVSSPAIGFFGVDSYKARSYLTLELGLRWEWNFTPTEARNRSSVFEPATSSLVQLGTNGVSPEFKQNNKLFEPRVGISWDVFHNGKTVLRSGYGLMYDQPLPVNLIFQRNPPFGLPIAFQKPKPTTTLGTLVTDAAGSGLTPDTVDPNFHDAYVQSYNLNIQQQLTSSIGVMIGYFGSKGTHLNMQTNINQAVETAPGVFTRPFPALSPTSPITPTTPAGQALTALSNIRSAEGIGTSHYNALWITATKHFAKGLEFNTNYTWSKSLDDNSQDFQGIVVQNSLNPFLDYGPSDFNAKHHFTFSALYDLPFGGENRLVSGWRTGTIVQLQSGNPLNILSGSPVGDTNDPISAFTGISTIRPDINGPLPTVGYTLLSNGLVQYFAGSVCDPTNTKQPCTGSETFSIPFTQVGGKNVYHFGNLHRNALVGPGFEDIDFSLTKTTKITERLRNEFRVEAFDVLNHPNFSNPGLTALPSNLTTTFGIIRATRNPTGDAGSSRQLQFAMKFIF